MSKEKTIYLLVEFMQQSPRSSHCFASIDGNLSSDMRLDRHIVRIVLYWFAGTSW